ncbi:MAG: hypothetical protein K6G47_00200, partial [Clostridia bacterium]|nr:hypothetical protein [Clostridia bacterium]
KYGEGVWTLYSYKSDPELEDTDGDYYFDQYDSKPLKNCIETYDLGGGEYEPLKNDLSTKNMDEGYIHIYDVPIKPFESYGGNQGWFGEEETSKNMVVSLIFKLTKEKIEWNIDVPVYFDEESGKDYLFLRESGCGLIAMTDVMLYLENGNTRISYDAYKSLFLSNARKVFDYSYIDDWFDFIEVVYPNNDENDDVFMPVPVLPITMSLMLDDMGYENNRLVVDIFDNKQLEEIITESLLNDKPVILNEMDCIGMLENRKAETKKGFPMYKDISSYGQGIYGEIDEANVMTDHYVTITGLIQDNQSDTVWLRVQTWGEEYYLRLDDFYIYNQSTLPYGTFILFV